MTKEQAQELWETICKLLQVSASIGSGIGTARSDNTQPVLSLRDKCKELLTKYTRHEVE